MKAAVVMNKPVSGDARAEMPSPGFRYKMSFCISYTKYLDEGRQPTPLHNKRKNDLPGTGIPFRIRICRLTAIHPGST
jgi:hypothetical protein